MCSFMFLCMFLIIFFIKVKKHTFYVFYLQINVFNIYGLNHWTDMNATWQVYFWCPIQWQTISWVGESLLEAEIWRTKPQPKHAGANCSYIVCHMPPPGEYTRAILPFAKPLWSPLLLLSLLPSVQCFPFQPGWQMHVPLLQCPWELAVHRASQSRWSQAVPDQPSSQTQRWLAQRPWLPQSTVHSSVQPATTIQPRRSPPNNYQSLTS